MAAEGALPLCDKLAKSSRKIHNVSNALVNGKLFALFSDRFLYGSALSTFYFVFKAIESQLDACLGPQGPPGAGDLKQFEDVLHGGIYRTAGFARDLEYFLGSDWEAAAAAARSPAVRAYEEHLAALARERPALLLAHVYTQHLAVASGGQVIKRLARKHLRLPEDRGTAAFDFEGESNNTLRSHLKAKLNKWGEGLDPATLDKLVQEHLSAFQHNNAIIRAFPVPALAVASGLVRVLPRQLLLAVLAAAAVLLLGCNAVALGAPGGALAGGAGAGGVDAAVGVWRVVQLAALLASMAPGWLLLGLGLLLVREA